MAHEANLDHETDTYWAAQTDPDLLVESLTERIRIYNNAMRTSLFRERSLRNWRYYHNLYYSNYQSFSTMELKQMGEQGKLVGASFSHFRAFCRHLISLITEERETFETKAINTEEASLAQARLGNRVLELYVERDRMNRYIARALEHAFILQEGFVLTEWDERRGEKLGAQIFESEPTVGPDGPMEPGENVPLGRYLFAGDVKWSNPSSMDVIRDMGVERWENHQWFIIRGDDNRWDLIARYPEWRDEILGYDEEEHDLPIANKDTIAEASDRVRPFTFFHAPCDALPEGRMLRFMPGGVYFDDPESPLPYRRGIQLRRIVDSEYMLSALGYSVMNDLQGPQEAFNAETSTICTNHRAFGVQNVWIQENDRVRSEQLAGKLQIVRSRTKPEGLNVTHTPAEIFKFRDMIEKDMEVLSGVNSVAKGQPEASLRSGTALALIDAKTARVLSPTARNYKECWSDVGTDTLHTLNDFAPMGHRRIISVTGMHGRMSEETFERGKLNDIDRVIVKLGNPLTRTTSGRLELANLYIKSGQVRMPEHLQSVIETGQIESLIEAERSQINFVRAENEKMRQGQPVAALITDYHVLHIREHQVLLNSTEVRMNDEMASRVGAHLMEHFQFISDPLVQEMQMTLGFSLGAFGMAPPVQEAAGRSSAIQDLDKNPERAPTNPPVQAASNY